MELILPNNDGMMSLRSGLYGELLQEGDMVCVRPTYAGSTAEFHRVLFAYWPVSYFQTLTIYKM